MGTPPAHGKGVAEGVEVTVPPGGVVAVILGVGLGVAPCGSACRVGLALALGSTVFVVNAVGIRVTGGAVAIAAVGMDSAAVLSGCRTTGWSVDA